MNLDPLFRSVLGTPDCRRRTGAKRPPRGLQGSLKGS